MEDGAKKGSGFILCTDSFMDPYGIIHLNDTFENHYPLRGIYLYSGSMSDFRAIVRPVDTLCRGMAPLAKHGAPDDTSILVCFINFNNIIIQNSPPHAPQDWKRFQLKDEGGEL
jgi:hypothetical protein